MKANPNSRFTILICSVFLLLLWLVPLAVSAQTYPLIYRLRDGYKDYSGTQGTDYHSHDGRRFYYSASDPLLITSFDESLFYESSDSVIPDYSFENIGFDGYTDYQPDYFVFRSPAPVHSPPGYRVSKLNYQGYYLEDSYYRIVSGMPTLFVLRKYFYNDDSKLVRMTRKSLSPVMNWNYEYILDSLGRRTDEIVTNSPDSVNWSPVKSLHYTYSGLPVSGNYQFEKHAPYTPEDFVNGNNFPYGTPYISDQWIIESISVIDTLGVSQTYPIVMTWGANAIASFNPPWGDSCHVRWNSYGLIEQFYYHGDITESTGVFTFSYDLSSVAISDPVNTPSVLDVTMHPNPTREFTKLSLTLPSAAIVQVSTYNMRGQEVKTESIAYQPNNKDSFNWMAVDRQGEKLPAGIYLLRIKAGTQSKTARVVVIH